jgi:histidinol-phosphate aminotransferase
MCPVEHLARASVLKLTPYCSARLESCPKGIHLDANENPFWREDGLNRYPDPQPERLKSILSQLYGVSTIQILITRGSDEGIDLLMRVFCEAGEDAVVITPPTYGMYEVSANVQGANIKAVPLLVEAGFALDKQHLLEEWDPSMKLIFLCSPNNPTGNVFAAEDILMLCEQLKNKALIVVDEAYIEFSTTESLSACLSYYDNLIILRTLSKAYGLAGVRLGSLLAHPDVIALLKKVIAPYPIPLPVVKAVLSVLSIKNQRLIQEEIQAIQAERERLFEFLRSLAYVQTVYPSEANFLLVRVQNAECWMSLCIKHDIAIRSRSQMLGLNNCVRISIGTQKENQRLQEVLADA